MNERISAQCFEPRHFFENCVVSIFEEKLEKSPERDRSRSRGRDTETNACVFWKMDLGGYSPLLQELKIAMLCQWA